MKEKLDLERITDAVKSAESITNAEIKVVIREKSTTMFQRLRSLVSVERLVLLCAMKEFNRQKLHETKERNAVMLYFSIQEKRFEILADINAYNHLGQKFLDEISASVSEEMKDAQGFNCEAIAKSVNSIAISLSEKYPKSDSRRNELSDDVVFES